MANYGGWPDCAYAARGEFIVDLAAVERHASGVPDGLRLAENLPVWRAMRKYFEIRAVSSNCCYFILRNKTLRKYDRKHYARLL
jgi:hypothetical protein